MRQRFTILVLIALLVPAIASAREQQPDDDSVVHGTINVALGNRNGLVVLTDSMLTRMLPSGGTDQLPNPGQKLFKLDDRTVCAIAGFVSAPASSTGITMSDLNTSTSAIIHEYVRQSKPNPRQSITEKLLALRALFTMHLDMIANVREVARLSSPLDLYTFQIIVAGYDNDDKPRIGRIAFRMYPSEGSLRANVEDIHLTNVEETLVSELNGISDVAEQILKHPASKPEDATVRQYAMSLSDNAGASLTTEQMVELAKRLKYYTQQLYREVGGIDQIAVLKKPVSVSIEQPSFPDPPKPPISFSLMVGGHVDGMNGVRFIDMPHIVFIKCEWNNVERELGGNYYIGNTFTNSLLTYNGGSVELGDTNHVTDSALVLQPLIDPNNEAVRRLERAFRWSAILLRLNGQLVVYATRP